MLKEFKEFVMRGNVLDLAIAVIIGGAFGAIVTSLINDVLMPPIGLALGHVDFKDLFLSLNGQSYASLAAAKESKEWNARAYRRRFTDTSCSSSRWA